MISADLRIALVSPLIALVSLLDFGWSQAHAAEGAPDPGQLVYQRVCAACHQAPPPGSRASPVTVLRKLSAPAIRTALTTGPMMGIGEGLSRDELDQVVAYLAAKPVAKVSTNWVEANTCAKNKRDIVLPKNLAPAGWGFDQANSRRLTAKQAGLRTADLGRLEVAWSLGLPETTALRSQGVVVGSTLFYVAGQANQLLAIDTQTGCVKWSAATPSVIRTSLALGPLGAKGPVGLVGGDSDGMIQAWDALTGKPLWRVDPRPEPIGILTGTPVFAGERLIVPVSAIDVALAMRPGYACCRGHGAVVALSAATGAKLWTYDTMPAAKPLGVKNQIGVEMQGPSGAPIWSSPSVDLKNGLVLTATGENTSPPATGTSDSVIAIDLATGKMKWLFQGLADDVWNMSCPSGRDSKRPPGANCFFYEGNSVLRDHDFGAGPVLATVAGRELVLAGQKSGDVWGLDRKSGMKVWQQKFGPGTALGGVHWGLTYDGRRLYVPISDPGVPADKSAAGLHAVNPANGKVLWAWRAVPDCDNGRAARVAGCLVHAGLSAAPMVIDQAVVAGALDGRLWILDAASGKVIAMHDTALPFTTRNGVPASGGAIDTTAVFAGDGMLFVNSGYSQFGQQPGNVLIAYRPRP